MKFYELGTASRLRMLADEGSLDQSDMVLLEDGPALPQHVAEHLIENQIGVFPVPLGLAEHFLIDGQQYRVPMATEEPSVIAAAGNAAQRVATSGGFHTKASRRGIVAQIVFLRSTSPRDRGAHGDESVDDAPQTFIARHRSTIMRIADDAHPTLRQHGGGLRSIDMHRYEEFLECDLVIATGEAMGANTVNTIAEAVADYLQKVMPDHDRLMAILSNQSACQRVRADIAIDARALATKQMPGAQVARRIVEAARFAQCSDLRAATHNKGIMNGINAVVLATGNDTRNVNAAAYADLRAERRTWTTWRLEGPEEADDLRLLGSIDIPMPIGSIGGAVSTLPMAQLSMKLLRRPSAAQLMGIAASVGLASNLSAMRALVTQGIQAGHMNLQLRSLAMMAGAEGEQLESLIRELRRKPERASLSEAQRLLRGLRTEAEEQ